MIAGKDIKEVDTGNVQNPIRLTARALGLWLGGRVHFQGNLQSAGIEDGGETFAAFRKVAVDPAGNQPARPGAVFQIRFRFRNLSATANRRLSLIPIPLIVAQPGFRSKTWHLGQRTGDFIGLYEFDTVEAAKAYRNSLPLRMMRRRAAEGSLTHKISRSDASQKGGKIATARKEPAVKSHDSSSRKVEQLGRYGVPLSDMPKEAFKGQGRIIFTTLRKKFGFIGLVPFTLQVLRERHRLLKKYADEYADLRALTPKGAKEITMLISMFNVIARRESRDDAYEFVKGIFQGVARQSMTAIYQLDDLLQCEGDVFDNFKKFNVAMFQAGERDFHVREIAENDHHLRIVVDRCLNVDAGRMFDCPEIAKLGCDHDLAGYPPIEKRLNMEFRRPCTIAKGDSFCEFNFYRKGFAPAEAFINK